VALAGGTGSGKSSLFNVILDSESADVGGIRPTTSRALASTPEEAGAALEGYLDALGELSRTRHRGFAWLALIDLPDTDSVEVDHRLRVEALLPMVDAVVWVADVEKYRDDSLHRGFIRRLSTYQSQFLFVLNQSDRVPRAEIDDLTADFTQALEEDGISDPKVLAVAANPPLTPPAGVDDLRIELRKLVDGSVVEKMLIDLEQCVLALSTAGGGSGLDFEHRWASVRDAAAETALTGDLIGSSRSLATFFAAVAGELWGSVSETALELSAHIGEDLRSIALSMETSLLEEPAPVRLSWPWRRSRDRSEDEPARSARTQHLVDELDGLIDSSFRPELRQRAVVVANLAALAIAVAESRSSHSR
jgi:GTP-binding protein EngB required for normal cell division